MKHIPSILAAFRKQSEQKGFEFMKARTPISGHGYTAGSNEKRIECSAELIDGRIDADYFRDGNTIMTGVDYEYPPGPSLGHWVVIAKRNMRLPAVHTSCTRPTTPGSVRRL